ncbi:MAG: N-acetylneuraminate synthase family protein [Planctomycetota bacterium]
MATDRLTYRHATTDAPAAVAVIAELGVNHDGDAAQARRLLDAAAEAGADAIKLQHFRPERLLSRDAELARYQQDSADDPRAMLDALTLPLDTMRALGEAAHDAGMALIVTPFSLADVDDLAELPIDAAKIASPDAVNTPMLDRVAALGQPLLVSTGTCDNGELGHAARVAQRSGGALLQCVSSYPAPLDQAGLGGIAKLRSSWDDLLPDAPRLRVGYSDHTPGPDTGAWAVAAGACLLEKHLTLDPTADGPDHAASLDPRQFADYVARAKQAAAAFGRIAKRVQPCEADIARVSRQSIVTTRDLPAGHALTPDDLAIKRPGTGLPARDLDAVVGRTLAESRPADTVLHPKDLA